MHGEGRAARQLIEQAREQVAALVGADARNVIFTSGGTEANALALSPSIEAANDKRPFDRLLVSAIEHPVGAGGRTVRPRRSSGCRSISNGVIDLAALEQHLESLRDSVFSSR